MQNQHSRINPKAPSRWSSCNRNEKYAAEAIEKAQQERIQAAVEEARCRIERKLQTKADERIADEEARQMKQKEEEMQKVAQTARKKAEEKARIKAGEHIKAVVACQASAK